MHEKIFLLIPQNLQINTENCDTNMQSLCGPTHFRSCYQLVLNAVVPWQMVKFTWASCLGSLTSVSVCLLTCDLYLKPVSTFLTCMFDPLPVISLWIPACSLLDFFSCLWLLSGFDLYLTHYPVSLGMFCVIRLLTCIKLSLLYLGPPYPCSPCLHQM